MSQTNQQEIVWVSLYFGDEFSRATQLKDRGVVNVDDLKQWANDTGFKKQLAKLNETDQADLEAFKGHPLEEGKAQSARVGEKLDPSDPVPSPYVVVQAPGHVWVSLCIDEKYADTKKIFAGSLMSVGGLKEWAKTKGYETELDEIKQVDRLKVFQGELDNQKVKKIENFEPLGAIRQLSGFNWKYFVVEAPAPVLVSVYIDMECRDTREAIGGSLMSVGELKDWAMSKGIVRECSQLDLKVFLGELNENKTQVKKMQDAEQIMPNTPLSECNCKYFVIEAPDAQETLRALQSALQATQAAPTGEAYEQYQTVGKLLESQDCVSQFLQLTKKIAKMRKPWPFIVLDGPSGIGKTQFPFALTANLSKSDRHDVVVRHVLAFTPHDLSQHIYRALVSVGDFWRFVCYDVGQLQEPTTQMLETMRNQTFFTISFLAKLFDVNLADMRPTIANFETQLQQHTNKTFVLFVDEVCGGHKEPERIMFARNLCRLVGIVVTMMGTDASAANFVGKAKESRQKEGEIIWAYLFTNLPTSNLKALQTIVPGAADWLDSPTPSPLVPFVERQLQRVRPWFGKILLQAAMPPEPENLDSLLSDLARKLAENKIQFWTDSLAQMCLLTCHDGELKDSADLIVHHYAHIVNPSPDGLLELKLRLILGYDDGKKFIEFSVGCQFKDEEELLFLTLPGTHNFHPLRTDLQNDIPVAKAWPQREHLKKLLENLPPVENRKARANDGNELEAFAAAVVCVSSRSGGIQGTLFKDFLLRVVQNLCVAPELQDLTWEVEPQGYWPDLRVPFLSVANRRWNPALVTILQSVQPGAYLGDLVRPENNQMRDFVITESIHGECKNYDRPFNSDVMTTILARVKTQVHLVFCNSVQSKYFSSDAPDTIRNLGSFWDELKWNIVAFRVTCNNNNKVALLPIDFSGYASRDGLPTSTVFFLARNDFTFCS